MSRGPSLSNMKSEITAGFLAGLAAGVAGTVCIMRFARGRIKAAVTAPTATHVPRILPTQHSPTQGELGELYGTICRDGYWAGNVNAEPPLAVDGSRYSHSGNLRESEFWKQSSDVEEFLDASAGRHITAAEPSPGGRTIIVGDVHGCCDELRDLLDNAGYDCHKDILILAGDVVNKGPKSVEALRLARELNCYAVCGNHELQALHAYSVRTTSSNIDGRERPLGGMAWVDALNDEDKEWLRVLPFTIRLPAHNAIVVHAGLVPGIPLEEQERWNMASMRLLVDDDESTASGRYRTPQAADWKKETLVQWAQRWTGPEHVYFGHDAAAGLQIEPFATGLDTGCMYGKKLSAAVLEVGKQPEIISVAARNVYIAPGLKL